jgi:hypothetical protein
MNEDQKEIIAERDEQIKKQLLKVCSPDELEDFQEWTEDNGFELYWTDDWIKLETNQLFTIEKVYAFYKNILRVV